MNHLLCRIVRFEILGEYRVHVEFDDGLSRTIDLAPILQGEVFGPLRDPELFHSATLDTEAHTIVWANGADFDPATLHDWPEHEDEMRIRAQQWAATTTPREEANPPLQPTGSARG